MAVAAGRANEALGQARGAASVYEVARKHDGCRVQSSLEELQAMAMLAVAEQLAVMNDLLVRMTGPGGGLALDVRVRS